MVEQHHPLRGRWAQLYADHEYGSRVPVHRARHLQTAGTLTQCALHHSARALLLSTTQRPHVRIAPRISASQNLLGILIAMSANAVIPFALNVQKWVHEHNEGLASSC